MGHSERKEWRDGLGATVEDMLVLSIYIYVWGVIELYLDLLLHRNFSVLFCVQNQLMQNQI